ncbi:IucA/IucC family protein [Saccharopolyspora sp. ID03-671]|uniref:IucA/IucC family protein n=1 Tax=Saccharopolyspora sp. ID03-671 TaxID=3073066 RepID=UPI003253D5CD
MTLDGVVLGHEEFVAVVAAELASRCGEVDEGVVERFRRQVGNSVARSARYLDRGPLPEPATPQEVTRRAEQSLLLGHPFHPTPKSAEGISDEDLERYAPELGASFQLHHWAVDPGLLLEDRVCDGPWLPGEPEAVLPVHPWQDRYLREHPRVQELIAAGLLSPLGAVGPEVYATSSVRTVCDPDFPTSWKLPLHVRITNFVRNNPFEHLRRAADAGRLVSALEKNWNHDGFEVLAESGYRTLDPVSVGDRVGLRRAVPPEPVRGHRPRPACARRAAGGTTRPAPGADRPRRAGRSAHRRARVRVAGALPADLAGPAAGDLHRGRRRV